MSKQVKKVQTVKGTSSAGKNSSGIFGIIPEKFRTPAAIAGIIILMLIFFSPVMFNHKTIDAGDIMQMKSTRAYINKTHDGFSLWNPYLFCGMPAYALSTELRWFDLTAYVYSAITKAYSAFFTSYEAIYTFSFLLLAITAFFFMRSRGAGHGVSFFTASAVSFSSGLVILFFIGHETKLMSLALLPFILMMLLKFQKEIKIFDLLLLTLGLHQLVTIAHVQIVYYMVLLVAVYFIFYIFSALINKDNFLLKQLLKSLGVMAAAGILALSMSLDTYLQLYEYTPYSQRDVPAAVSQSIDKVESKTETEQYKSNTRWSFSPEELTTFVIPSFYGFGNSIYKEESSGQEYQVNTYFGQMEAVDSPMYMGIIVLVLAIMAFLIRWKDSFVKFSLIVIIMFLLLSFGKNFTLLFNIFYIMMPKFDVFRAPSMILHIIQVLLPILAGLAILRIIELKNEGNLKFVKAIKISALIFSGIAVLSLLFTSALSNGFISRVNAYAGLHQDRAQELSILSKYMAGMYTGDLQISMLLIAALLWGIYLFLNNKLNKNLFVAAIVVFTLFDLFRIGMRSSAFSFRDTDEINAIYQEPDYVKTIKQQNDKEPFRIASFRNGRTMQDIIGGVGFNANYHTYFGLEDLNGYSSAKPRGFHEIYTSSGTMRPTLWRMAGVKYLVFSQPINAEGYTLLNNSKNVFLYRNEAALPRAYFVDSVEAKKGSDIIKMIDEDAFDPKNKAFVDNVTAKVDKPGQDAYTKIKSYSDAKLILEANATGNNFLFFSTNYMPKGWKATVDGKETEIVKANNTFMGIVVPAGKHTVEFVYAPSSFFLGKYLSLILNILLFGGLIYLAVMKYRKKKLLAA